MKQTKKINKSWYFEETSKIRSLIRKKKSKKIKYECVLLIKILKGRILKCYKILGNRKVLNKSITLEKNQTGKEASLFPHAYT